MIQFPVSDSVVRPTIQSAQHDRQIEDNFKPMAVKTGQRFIEMRPFLLALCLLSSVASVARGSYARTRLRGLRLPLLDNAPPSSSLATSDNCNRNLNIQIPFQWTCHSSDDLTFVGPSGKALKNRKIGVFRASMGEHVYQYDVEESGTFLINSGGKTIANFTTHPENCYCPETMEDFKQRFKCDPHDERVIERMLSRWLPDSISREHFEKEELLGQRRLDHVRVTIINNVVHFKRIGGVNGGTPSKGRKSLQEFRKFLLSLTRKVKLPDCDFYHIYAYDGPFIPWSKPIPPIVSQGYHANFAEVPGPTKNLIQWIFNGEPLQFAASGQPWKDRIPMAFFRGSLTGKTGLHKEDLRYNSRFRMVLLGKNHSAIDARILMRYTGDGSRKEFLRPSYGWLPMDLVTDVRSDRDAIRRYKYVLNPDGNAASWRMYYQMAMGAVVVKQKSLWEEWWYHKLEDGVNFVETGRYFSDVRDVVDWLLAHDELAEKVAQNAFSTWAQKMRAEDTYCWTAVLIEKIAEKLGFTPTVPFGAESARNKDVESCRCQYGSHL